MMAILLYLITVTIVSAILVYKTIIKLKKRSKYKVLCSLHAVITLKPKDLAYIDNKHCQLCKTKNILDR